MQGLLRSLEAPSRRHLMGTDRLGRDLFSEVGTVAGVVASYSRGRVDDVVMRVAETLSSIPRSSLSC